MRTQFVLLSLVVIAVNLWGVFAYPPILWSLVAFVPILTLGYMDFFQVRHTIRRNFPILGWGRYLFEMIRPEINQYFVESNTDGVPFSREQRSLVYQRAKGVLDTLPFGTQSNVYDVGYEWVNHSMMPSHINPNTLRVTIGGPNCKKPYSSSVLNVSAMSYGALSKNAVMSLNAGAQLGGFAQNTGEGGLTPYHLQMGGDLIWQIGTGYFGCRNHDGSFNPDNFVKRAALDNVKMIELKISQGAKPGHGGILPAAKVTKEIAEIRGVPMGKDVLSPPAHTAFTTPIEMMLFIGKLRELSGGKPVGFKACLGKRREFLALCKAMIKTGITPDYISIDGGEGGTGAAPLEFSNHVGSPGMDAIVFVHNALIGYGLRDRIRLLASGKVTSAFSMIRCMAAGVDVMYSARGMMLALGCIQALKCNSNHCPTGVATQNPSLMKGLVVSDKKLRVARFHKQTIESLAEILGAMGLERTSDLRPWHVMRRISPLETRHYGEIYEFIKAGVLLTEQMPKSFERAARAASAESFRHVD